MSVKLLDLIKNPSLLKSLFPNPICGICDQEITDEYDGMYTYQNKSVHSDCWFEKLGEEIEKHPICSPRVRRG